MDKSPIFQKTERPSRLFIIGISIIGWIYIILQLFQMESWHNPLIYGVLFIFLAICEYYPIPIWKGNTSLSFPIVFVLYFVYGLEITVVSYAIVILLINIKRGRPFRICCFNPAQLTLSFFLAVSLTNLLLPFLGDAVSPLTHIIELLLLSTFFYIVNNLLVDIVLILRPQPYPFTVWKQKLISEINSAVISILYGSLYILLGSQERGQVDGFIIFFFFSPLIGLALYSSTIVRVKIERNRLNALFSLTTTLNKLLPTSEWVNELKISFHELIDVEGILLWIKEDGKWVVRYQEGKTFPANQLDENTIELFENLKKPLTVGDRKNEHIPASEYFDHKLRCFVYAPLVVEHETVGVFVVARNRTKSIIQEEVQSIATLANQLAVIIKTRMLIEEKEKRILLEERNRIARDIHDGIAQSIAGALMKLETAQRHWEKAPEKSIHLVSDSMERLRDSLKQVRQSIYALRPYPTERVGLQSAILQKINEFEKETELVFVFEERGKPEVISRMVEKILFDTFQESVQNIIKHAKATNVEILLSYQKENILLRIKDDGVGFSLLEAMLKAQKEPHFGILSMNDSAEKIGASLQIDSKLGAGTEICMTVPKMGIEGK
jgi:signal transduction histidine kinase